MKVNTEAFFEIEVKWALANILILVYASLRPIYFHSDNLFR